MKEEVGKEAILKITQNIFAAGVGLISAILYSKQAYEGIQIRLDKTEKL